MSKILIFIWLKAGEILGFITINLILIITFNNQIIKINNWLDKVINSIDILNSIPIYVQLIWDFLFILILLIIWIKKNWQWAKILNRKFLSK